MKCWTIVAVDRVQKIATGVHGGDPPAVRAAPNGYVTVVAGVDFTRGSSLVTTKNESSSYIPVVPVCISVHVPV